MTDYSFNEFKKKLIKIGIKKNDLIYCHSNIGFFGNPNEKNLDLINHNDFFNDKNIINYLSSSLIINALKNNCNVIFLECRPSNKIAIHLYESEGFSEVGLRKDYYPSQNGKEDGIIFAKQIFNK